MKSTPRSVVLVIAVIMGSALASTLEAQPLRSGFGAFVDYQYNLHAADFRALPGVPSCCPQYVDGGGSGFGIGLLYELPIAERMLVAIRGSYATHGGLLQSQESTTVGIAGVPTEALIEHSLDASLASVGIEPMLGYRIADGLFLNGGGRIGLVTTASYTQDEVLLSPAGTFENGLRTRNAQGGEIHDASSLYSALIAGINYRLPMNAEQTLILVPELQYAFGLTQVVRDLNWTAGGLRAGVAVIFSPPQQPEQVAPPPPPVPAPTRPDPTPTVRLAGLDAHGKESAVSKVVVGEYVSTQFRPLLTYVFFAEDASEIPVRYRRLRPEETTTFSIDALHHAEMLDVHHHLLNIIGYRMRKHPEAALTITGCNADKRGEKGNTALSRSRAEAVRDYLARIWGISDARLGVRARELPVHPSNSEDEDGIAENRRVELTSDTWEIVDPVVTRDFERQVTPSRMRFIPADLPSRGVASWSLTILQSGEELRAFTGEGAMPDHLDWEVEREQASVPTGKGSMDYVLALRTTDGMGVSTRGSVTVEQQSIDKIVGRYSLILFDFDDAEIRPANSRIVGMIRPSIDPEATVEISGYTDRIGERDYNQRLSEGRAKNTARLLDLPDARVEGLGKSVLLYNNDLPEGRFYSRTVTIFVELKR